MYCGFRFTTLFSKRQRGWDYWDMGSRTEDSGTSPMSHKLKLFYGKWGNHGEIKESNRKKLAFPE